MEYPKGRSDLPGGLPSGEKRPPGGQGLEEPAQDRNPEIARFLEQQKNLIEALTTIVVKTDHMLTPILRPKPPKGTEDGRARVEAMTGVGAIIDQNNRALDGLIGSLVEIQKRIEI